MKREYPYAAVRRIGRFRHDILIHHENGSLDYVAGYAWGARLARWKARRILRERLGDRWAAAPVVARVYPSEVAD